MKVGSPEWFHVKAQTEENEKFILRIEEKRKLFFDRFSPEMLRSMSNEELLLKVFADYDDSMVRLLMFDDEYRSFGAAGKYKYTGVVYQNQDGGWYYKESSHSINVSKEGAMEKADYVRNMLLACIEAIEEHKPFSTLSAYESLEKDISRFFIYQYAWVMKYYQMIYPQYFPGMYADKTIDRCLSIIGLPNHGSTKRLINAGELSLFIRRCDVNNLVFGSVYASQWGWEYTTKPPCENAKENYEQRTSIVVNDEFPYYSIPGLMDMNNSSSHLEQVKEIDDEVEVLDLKGEDRDAIVKVRINQGFFRAGLLRRYGKCCLCGVDNPSLLRASHIKPWAKCEPEEEVDLNNGLLLCPNHDSLFDQGYISFDDDGSILISNQINDNNRMFMNVRDNMRIRMTDGNSGYMAFHREHIYKE